MVLVLVFHLNLIFTLALTIIAEHSFFLWDQKHSEGCVAAAVDHYKRSPNCGAVKTAVNAVFEEHSGHIFKQNTLRQGLEVREEFQKRLIQIALDNRLCKLNC